MFFLCRTPRVLILAIALASTSLTCFGMDVLQAYKLALENDKQLRAAQAQYAAGIEALPQAQSRLYPSLALSNSRLTVSQDRKDGETQFPNQRYPSKSDNLSLRQPLYNPRLWALKDQAIASVASADASLNGEQQNLAIRLTESYLSVLSARERDALVQSQIKLTESRLLSAQKSFAAGVGIRTDIDEIQAQLDILQAQALQATNSIFTATSELEMLTGKPIEKFFVINKQTFQPEQIAPGSLDTWLTNALSRNNEVRYRSAQRDALAAALESVHAEDLPTLDGVAQINRNSGENAYFVNSKTDNRSVGVQFNLPLYQGGWFSSRQRQALANLTEGQEMLDRAELMAKNEVRKTYFLLRESLMRVAALEKANTSAQTVVIANQKSFQAGVRTTLDVLAAEQRVIQVAVDLVEARAQSLNAWIRLKALTSDVDEATFQLLSSQFKAE
jgi:outer membrane protein, protease secretion system